MDYEVDSVTVNVFFIVFIKSNNDIGNEDISGVGSTITKAINNLDTSRTKSLISTKGSNFSTYAELFQYFDNLYDSVWHGVPKGNSVLVAGTAVYRYFSHKVYTSTRMEYDTNGTTLMVTVATIDIGNHTLLRYRINQSGSQSFTNLSQYDPGSAIYNLAILY